MKCCYEADGRSVIRASDENLATRQSDDETLITQWWSTNDCTVAPEYESKSSSTLNLSIGWFNQIWAD
ncbi:hypothetical protein QVD17_08376 [Tagetes erecta]|uniref:Uncharacterized protein n=1 Tax=Tagetes erecta TaxID=13708 RepID=A0AAD8L2Q9_TARER|nr:hypothetical protein QVD17_08376 [Tagetes erecta]